MRGRKVFFGMNHNGEYETVTETTSVVQDANELGSNNIYQSGENAVYNSSAPEVNNGETNNNS